MRRTVVAQKDGRAAAAAERADAIKAAPEAALVRHGVSDRDGGQGREQERNGAQRWTQ